jgi:hypothetical protein
MSLMAFSLTQYIVASAADDSWGKSSLDLNIWMAWASVSLVCGIVVFSFV